MYSFFGDNNSVHEKGKSLNKNVVPTQIYNKYKDVLLNNKYLRHAMNLTKRGDHKIGTYEINKVSLSCFDDKKYI